MNSYNAKSAVLAMIMLNMWFYQVISIVGRSRMKASYEWKNSMNAADNKCTQNSRSADQCSHCHSTLCFGLHTGINHCRWRKNNKAVKCPTAWNVTHCVVNVKELVKKTAAARLKYILPNRVNYYLFFFLLNKNTIIKISQVKKNINTISNFNPS